MRTRRFMPAALSIVLALALVGCAAEAPTLAKARSSASPSESLTGRILFRQYLDAANTQGALFSMDADGTNRRQLTHPADNELDAAGSWSPDGTKIVFTRSLNTNADGESHQLVVMNADGSGQKALTPGKPMAGTDVAGFDDLGTFSPDGRSIAYEHSAGDVHADGGTPGRSDVWVMNADGTGARNVTNGKPYSGERDTATWSPDGKQLLYVLWNVDGATPANGRALFVIDTDGTGDHRITSWKLGADGTPDWSSTIGRIAFRSAPDEETGVGNFFTIKPDGTALHQVTHMRGLTASHRVSFSPDGRSIVFARAVADGTIQLATEGVDGGPLRPLVTTGFGSSSADWG
jgi:Tol biopolymer transport system component